MPEMWDGEVVRAPVNIKRRFIERHERLFVRFRMHGILSQSGRKYIRASIAKDEDNLDCEQTPIYVPLVDFGRGHVWADKLYAAETVFPYAPYASDFRYHAAQVDKFDRHFVLERPGWDGAAFVHRNGTALRAVTEDEGFHFFQQRKVKFSRRSDFQGEIVFRPNLWRGKTSGSLDDLKDGLSRLMPGQDLLLTGLVLSLTSVLLHWSSISSFGLVFIGPPGGGGAELCQLAASLWGEPSEDSELERNNHFGDHLETELQLANDHLVVLGNLDRWFALENATRRAENVKSLAAVFNHNHEFPADALFPRTRLMVLATTPVPIESLCDDADAARTLLEGKLLSVDIPATRQGSVVATLPTGFATPGAYLRAVRKLITGHHGVAANHFIENLMREIAAQATIRSDIAGLIEEFIKLSGITPDGPDELAAAQFGLIYAAGRLATRFGTFPADLDIERAILDTFSLYRQQPGPVSVEHRLRALLGAANVIDLGRGKHGPEVSDEERASAIAYSRERSGSTLICIRESDITRVLPDWPKLEHSAEVEALRVCEVEHRGVPGKERRHLTKQVVLGKGRKKERCHCFALPPT